MVKHGNGTLKYRCAQDMWDLEIFCEQISHIPVSADHRLKANYVSCMKDTWIITDSLRRRIPKSFFRKLKNSGRTVKNDLKTVVDKTIDGALFHLLVSKLPDLQ